MGVSGKRMPMRVTLRAPVHGCIRLSRGGRVKGLMGHIWDSGSEMKIHFKFVPALKLSQNQAESQY